MTVTDMTVTDMTTITSSLHDISLKILQFLYRGVNKCVRSIFWDGECVCVYMCGSIHACVCVCVCVCACVRMCTLCSILLILVLCFELHRSTILVMSPRIKMWWFWEIMSEEKKVAMKKKKLITVGRSQEKWSPSHCRGAEKGHHYLKNNNNNFGQRRQGIEESYHHLHLHFQLDRLLHFWFTQISVGYIPEVQHYQAIVSGRHWKRTRKLLWLCGSVLCW